MMSALLKQRFQSSTRADRACAELRFVKQGEKESVHAYSCRFTMLLQKLPLYDADWAISQYIWGLSPKTTELVMMNRPTTLATALQRANDIELARQAAHLGTQQQQRTWNPSRYPQGRGCRGRGLATYVASS